MLQSDWLRCHKKEIRTVSVVCLILMVCLLISSISNNGHFIKDGKEIIAITRDNLEETLTLPLEIEAEKDGKKETYHATLSIKGMVEEDDTTELNQTEASVEENFLDAAIQSLIEEIEEKQDVRIVLPTKLEDGTRLRWKEQIDLRFLLAWLLLPAGLLYIYESEQQREKDEKKKVQEEIRSALPSFVDQLLLLLNAGMIFQDAFYRITAGYGARTEQDAFCNLLARIRKEADETGVMVITVMKRLSQEIGVREYVRMVNIMVDHQHRGVNLEEKLQAESRLLWEGRKVAAMQKGKEMETKLTFPLAVLLITLIIIAGTPALMNM